MCVPNIFGRAGKKLKMSTRGHFEGSEMSSKVHYFQQIPNFRCQKSRAGKKLKMSTHGHFEGSEMSSNVRDFRHKNSRQKCGILGPFSILILNTSSILDPQSSIFNPNPNHHPQYFLILNPQSSILNPQTSNLILNL